MLPPQYDPRVYEKKWWDFWTSNRIFAADPDSKREPYVILMPPPNVTDRLHMGHGLNNTIQDIYIRWQRMQGKEVCWLPGTDHAGIATQMMVEKSLQQQGLDRRQLGREEFVKRCWQWKEKHGDLIVKQLKRLGASADWDRQAFTMSAELSQAVRCMFVDLYRKGLIYRGERLVNWDFELQTAISDDEVVNVEEKGRLWSFAYPLTDGTGELVVATTRPETMFGDVAVAVNPQDERYQKYIGKTVYLPLTERVLPVIADEYVKSDFGTGCVKITPGHDFNDFTVGKRHDLPLINIFDTRGHMAAGQVPVAFTGLSRPQARVATVKSMQEKGLLRGEVSHRMTMPYSDRSKTVIEPLLSQQWFLRMQPLVPEAVQVAKNGKLKFYPANWEKTYLYWLENIEDWCISRQLWWGHRIPVWHCADCAQPTPGKTDPNRCEHCGSSDIQQDEDVLDTWFSSWLWPFSTLGWPDRGNTSIRKFYPSAVLITGADIIFLWVARMVIAGIEAMGTLPFRDVYFNSIICDHQGRKFSKTLGNGIDPLEVIEAHGADAVRYTCVSLAPLGGRARMGVKDFVHGGKFINKIWNASRFLLSHLDKADPLPALSTLELTTVEKWLVNELAETSKQVNARLQDYRINNMAEKLYHFIWGTYCDWGVEIAKNILARGTETELTRILATMDYVMDGLLRLAHPVMPFVSEEIWQKLPAHPDWDRPLSLALAKFPDPQTLLTYEDKGLESWALTRKLITAVRTLRSRSAIPPAEKINISIAVTVQPKAVQEQARWISDLALVADITWLSPQSPRPTQALVSVGDGFEVYAQVAAYLDLEQEKQKLQRECLRLTNLLAKLNTKLNNPSFRAKAPQEILEKQQTQKISLEKQLASIELNLKSLAG